MDLEEWEFIPGDRILMKLEEEEEERSVIRYANWTVDCSKSVVDTNYFECPVVEEHQEPVSQVFFNTAKEPEFADIKMRDFPKSPQTARGGSVPASAAFDFDFENTNTNTSESDQSNKINLWKLGITGFGAICSFGITVCVLFFGTQHSHKHRPNIAFRVHTDEKMKKKKKKKNDMKPNDAGFAIRGANVTFGGFYGGP